MPYTIHYSPETGHKYPVHKNHRQVNWGRWLMLISIFAGSIWLRLNGIPDFMIPGDPEITKSAAVMMLSNLRNGVSISDAFAVFCQEILNGAIY